MDDLEKRLKNDRLIIFLGALGCIGAVCAIILSLTGYTDFSFTSVLFLIICVFLLVFGIKQSKEDKEKFDMQSSGDYTEYAAKETSKYQTGRKRRK